MPRDSPSRRQLISALGTIGVSGLAGCASNGNGNNNSNNNGTSVGDGGGGNNSVSVGLLFPLSGPTKSLGLQSLRSVYSGLAYNAGTDPIADTSTGRKTFTVDNTDFELFVRDTEYSPDVAQTVAQNLVTNEEVDIFIGTNSPTAGRVIKNVAKPANVPLVTASAPATGITTQEATCGEQIFRTIPSNAMIAKASSIYIANQTEVSSVYQFGSDTTFGRSLLDEHKRVLENNDVNIVNRRLVPQGYDEWSGLLSNADDTDADAINTGLTVATLPSLVSQLLAGDYSFDHEYGSGFGVKARVKILGETLKSVLGEPLTQEKLNQTPLGPYNVIYAWNQYDNPINQSYVDMYTKTWDTVPDALGAAGFAASSAVDQAIKESGSTNGADIANAMRGMTIKNHPKGENSSTFQEYNNQATSAITVSPVAPNDNEDWGVAYKPGEPLKTYSGDELSIPKDNPRMGCSL